MKSFKRISRTIPITKALTFLFILNLIGSTSYAQNPFEGIWIGNMEINEKTKMKVAFEVSLGDNQELRAVMHSVDQEAYDLPIDNITVEGSNIRLQVSPLNAVFNGLLAENGILEGHMTQGKNAPWVLNMEMTENLPRPKPKRTQEPDLPYPYQVEELTFPNDGAGVTLAGTLTIPQSPGPHPAIILISGSGPNDRDATIFGHKYFLVLADQLTRSGYAVLRVDDRGTAESSGDFDSASIVELADDVVAGIEYLKSRSEINKNQIGLIGHSLGAVIAPIAADQSDDVAYIVMMAGVAVPLYQGIYEQTEAYYSKMVRPEAVQLNTEILETVFEVIRDEEDNGKALEIIGAKLERFNTSVAELTAEEQKFLNMSMPLLSGKYKFFMTPAMRVDLFYDQKASIQKVTCPVLALNGSLDLQVLPKNLEDIENALKEGGNKNFTVKLFEGKNHLFQCAKAGTPDEYGKIEETISPDVLEFLISWLDQLTIGLRN
ncbi:MAG TPA: alpha/beta fold hydrolase [Anditalea sp.]|nr:alpha/beta fold hydrolase [Anditalea sp.]